MIQDFQQTTVASIGLPAQANTVCVSVFASQPTTSPCLPGHRHPVKELHSPLESREIAKTMPRPLVVRACGDWRPMSADGASASPVPVPRPEPQQPEAMPAT